MDRYQPSTFEEFVGKREDCEERYQAIKTDYGNFDGDALLDIGCAEGFFGFRLWIVTGKLFKC